MIPDIDRLRARRWLNELNLERRERGQAHFEYDLVVGSATIELIERHSDLVLSLVRFRYINTQASWRVQQQVKDGKFRMVSCMPITPYLAVLLGDVGEMRDTFIPSLRRTNDLFV